MYRLRPFRLQFASNLFVHRGAPDPNTLLRPAANNLALLGNIGSVWSNADYEATRDFLLFCAARWANTYWIPGHTELASKDPVVWRDTYTEAAGLAEEVTANAGGGRITFLDCKAETFLFHGVRLLGATGWNPVPKRLESPPETDMPPIWMWEANANRPFKPIDSQLLFSEEAEWLDTEFRSDPKTPSILLTSALPSPMLLGRDLPAAAYKLCDLTTFYPASFLKPTNLVACLGGATGSVASGTWQKRYHAVNSYRAYPGAPPNPNYDPAAVYEFAGTGRGTGGGGALKASPLALPALPKFPLPLPVAPNAFAIC